MSEDQNSIVSWMNETFPGADPLSPRKSLRALEEMVELCLACGASPKEVSAAVSKSLNSSGAFCHFFDGWPSVGTAHAEKIRAEAADVLIVLYGVAGLRGFDLHEEVARKMHVNRSRKWAVRGDGTGYHIKDQS